MEALAPGHPPGCGSALSGSPRAAGIYGDGTKLSSEIRFAVAGADVSQPPVSPLGHERPFSNGRDLGTAIP